MAGLDYSFLYTEPQQESSFPGYIYASDNHNYGNGNFAFTDPSTWGEKLGNAGKFVLASVASGAASIWNSGVAATNWFGADNQELNVAAALSSFDDDLGKYYKQNKEIVDVAGFIIGSIVPGMAGVKVLNAGQTALRAASNTGMVGNALSTATGLLAPAAAKYTKLAAVEIAQTSATFSSITGNTLKAIGAGYGQAALEAAAFEVAVNATMFKSPVLDEKDAWDLVKNSLTGVAVGGVIGGAISHARVFGAIKKDVLSLNPAEKTFGVGADITYLTPAQRIIARQDRLENLAVVPTVDDIASGAFPGTSKILEGLQGAERAEVSQGLYNKFSKLRSETVQNLTGEIRADIHALTTGKDVEFSNAIADITLGTGSLQTLRNFTQVTEIGRLKTSLATERAISKGGESAANKTIGFVKLSGDDAGNLYFDAPRVSNLADEFGSKDEILAQINKYKFKEKNLWEITQDSNHLEVEARYIWADKFAKVESGITIHERDIPLLEKARDIFTKAAEGNLDNPLAVNAAHIKVSSADGIYEIHTLEDLLKHIEVSKQGIAFELVSGKRAGTGITAEEIAKMVNVRRSYLEDMHAPVKTDDLYARQYFKSQYEQSLKDTKLYSAAKVEDFDFNPTWAKVAYDTKPLEGMDNFVLEGMAYIKAKQKIYADSVRTIIAAHLPMQLSSRLTEIPDDILLGANRFGAGPGLVTSANGNFGSLASITEQLGVVTRDIELHFNSRTQANLQSTLHRLLTNTEDAIEVSSINKKISGSSELYALAPDGSGAIPVKLLDYQTRIAAGEKNLVAPVLQEGAEPFIPFKTVGARDYWNKAVTGETGPNTQILRDVRAAQGFEDVKDIRVLRPIRPNPKDYPYFAIVVDDTINGVGHKQMIHAASPKELEELISKVPNKYTVFRKDQMENYFKQHGKFDYEQTLHENYINSDLRSAGINTPFFIKTDPKQIVEDIIQHHKRSNAIVTREIVNANYEKEFAFLREQGEAYTSVATSKYTGSYKAIEAATDNPYTNYIKTALNITQLSEHPYLTGFNTYLDRGVSSIVKTLQNAGKSAGSVEELEATNELLKKYGVQSAYYDTATNLLANHSAPKGELTKFIRLGNAILSNLTLRFDPLNALNNAVGANVLYGTEVRSILRAAKEGNEEIAGKLALKLPGVEDSIRTPYKIWETAVKNFHNKDAVSEVTGRNLHEMYKQNSWTTTISDQIRSIQDDLILNGDESVKALSDKKALAFQKFREIGDKLEKGTGNKLAEEFNRFIAADSMRQLTDVKIAAGVMTEKESLSYINTFVHRTQGNMVASQRPLMFQGPIGQAVGLFQTYQFNLMQQMFRHVAEGSGKDAAMLLGLQGTFYGMNGLPAFNFMNTHIVGTMSGNQDHKDLYTTTYGITGQEIGDLLIYGLPSKMLQGSLYTRGDINPRFATVIPTNPVDIPIVNATIKSYANLENTLSNIAGGGDLWKSFLQGIEHNGLSRPMAGAAQLAQGGYSTSSKGNIMGANDILSWASAIRLVGGKPLDEAIMNDATFRVSVYQAKDREKKQDLSKAMKTTLVAGNIPDADQVHGFMESYIKQGGKQGEFNKYMLGVMKEANTSQVNKIVEHLNTPYAKNLQYIMGGRELRDGNDL